MSFYLNSNFLDKFSTIEKAENYEYFTEVSSCVYFWYYPITFKSNAVSFSEILEDFQSQQSPIFNEVHSIELQDRKQKYSGKISGIGMNAIIPPKFYKEDEMLYQRFHQTFLAFSLLNKPIYIGKSTRFDSSIKSRIKEHLSLTTDFSKSLQTALNRQNSDLTIHDLLVRVVDIEQLREDYFSDYIGKEEDFAYFFEKILINLYKPKYNIQQ